MYHAGCLGTAVPQVSLCAQVYLLINYPLCSLPSSRVAGPRETLAFPGQVFMLGLITGGGGGQQLSCLGVGQYWVWHAPLLT